MSKPGKAPTTKPQPHAPLADPADSLSPADRADPAKVKAARVAGFRPTGAADKATRRQAAIDDWQAA